MFVGPTITYITEIKVKINIQFLIVSTVYITTLIILVLSLAVSQHFSLVVQRCYYIMSIRVNCFNLFLVLFDNKLTFRFTDTASHFSVFFFTFISISAFLSFSTRNT